MTSCIFYVIDNYFEEIHRRLPTKLTEIHLYYILLKHPSSWQSVRDAGPYHCIFFTCPTVKDSQVSNMFPCNTYKACYRWNTVYKI